jgi:hypothetical protein
MYLDEIPIIFWETFLNSSHSRHSYKYGCRCYRSIGPQEYKCFRYFVFNESVSTAEIHGMGKDGTD